MSLTNNNMGAALSAYYKMLLGIEIRDTQIVLLNPQRILVSKALDRCVLAAVNELHPEFAELLSTEDWFLWATPRLPLRAEDGPDLQVLSGAIEFTQVTELAEIESEYEWDGFDGPFEEAAASEQNSIR